MNFEEFCRRRMRRRIAAVRTAIERRQDLLASAAGPGSDTERIERESRLRLMRVQTASGKPAEGPALG